MTLYRRKPLTVCAFRWAVDPTPDWFTEARQRELVDDTGYLLPGEYVLMEPTSGKPVKMERDRFLEEYEFFGFGEE